MVRTRPQYKSQLSDDKILRKQDCIAAGCIDLYAQEKRENTEFASNYFFSARGNMAAQY